MWDNKCDCCCMQCNESAKCKNSCDKLKINCDKCYDQRFYIGTHDGGIDD